MNNVEKKIVVIGASTGGIAAIKELLSPLPKGFAFPIIIVQHRATKAGDYFEQYLQNHVQLKINTVNESLALKPGNIYLAPSDQHIRIRKKGLISPYSGPILHYARPSIDVLFKSAAEFYQSDVIALILTGSNKDGAEGCAIIAASGGQVFIQNPASADAKEMPESCLNKVPNAIQIECNQVGGILWDIAYHPTKQIIANKYP